MSGTPPPEDIRSLTKAELVERANKELWGQWTYALVGAIASVPLSRHVPRAQRFYPLLVLGAVGSLADFAAGQKRAEPFKTRIDELDALEAQSKSSHQ